MSDYDILAERMGYKGSKYLPKVFECAANERQARVLVELLAEPGPPVTVDKLATRTGFDPSVIKEDLEVLWHRGLAFPRNFQNRVEWRGPRNSPQIRNSMLSSHMFYPDPQKLKQVWKDFDENEGYHDVVKRIFEDTTRTRVLIRVIPTWQSVKDNPNLQPWEDWREIMKKAATLAVVDCPCRFEVEGCDKPLQTCIDFNREAEYDIASGHGRKLTVEEALEIMDQAALGGEVGQALNTREVAGYMCNCCDCCCVAWLPLKQQGVSLKKNWAPSRYEARVDQGLCTGCQKCIDQCLFDTMKMQMVPGSKKMKAWSDPETCMGCGLCFMVCDDKAITMECVRPPEHVPEGPIRPNVPAGAIRH